MIAAVVAPVFQAYVPPPLAVKVVLSPTQIFRSPVMAAFGSGLTVTVVEVAFEQPAALVTVTV